MASENAKENPNLPAPCHIKGSVRYASTLNKITQGIKRQTQSKKTNTKYSLPHFEEL